MAQNPSFAGRLGGVQQFTVNRKDPEQESLLEKVPDAAPNVDWRDSFRFSQFKQVVLWKAAMIEGIGTFVLVFATTYMGSSPNTRPPNPSATSGPFGQANFIGPATAFFISGILITLLIYCLGSISGGHLNPMITIATFMTRLTTFPRMVLYIGAQLIGASLAGLMLRAALNTRDFKIGGCYLFEDENTTASSALVVEFVGCTLVLFLAFGLGLDPRQAELFGPSLAPVLVGIAVATVTFALSFSRPAYGGASLNPARCFGVFVGSRFESWTWVTWVGPIAASVFHAVVYLVVPPSTATELHPSHDKDEESHASEAVAGFRNEQRPGGAKP